MARLAAAGAVDRFSLVEVLHAGGFGLVYRVTGPTPDAPLVMKVPRLDPEAPASGLASHEAERAILATLRGPHVPRLVAAGDPTLAPYLVMEEIRGTSLAAWTGRAPVAAAEVARLGAAVARALEALHAQRVVHLDVKPENVLSLGVVLYELATGALPFGAPRSRRGLRRRLYRDPVPPRALVPVVPEWLQEVVLWCLEPEPSARPASAAGLADALSAPERVPRGARARRTRRDGLAKVLLRRIRAGAFEVPPRTRPPPVVQGRRTVLVAVATAHANEPRHHELREAVRRIVQADAACRVTCVSIIEPAPGLADPAAPQGSRALRHLALLRRWAEPLGLPERRIAFHVLESSDPAATLLHFTRANPIHHVVVGAPPADEALKRLFGTVSSKLADEAPCDVTVVRYPS
ncbi:MAG TPA: bifunctional serine/threonine-protein kinase/universal stress protein [Anaeromyxobacter sp.]|nr:bifunctional serine/threonine-protein kinase/universal stress protein [Anaeromyxobacter sp.]